MLQHILVADDDLAVRNFLHRTLVQAGYEVAVAANGQEALRLFSSRPFDLVITDILMPDCDGLELLLHIRQVRPKVPVIAITGADNDLFGQDARGLGALFVLPKPFGGAALHEAVRRALPAPGDG